jgi:hypothetical protein
MSRITDLAVQVAEGLRDGDTLAVGQALADARALGGRAAVLGVLDAACVWLWRTGPRTSHQPDRSEPAAATTAARNPPNGTTSHGRT